MAGLPFGEQVSGTSEIQIALADGKAGAGLAELLQNSQTLLGLLRSSTRVNKYAKARVPPRPTRPLS